MHQSPLVAMEESSSLTKGIKGVTIYKQINDNRLMTTSRVNTQHKSRLPILYVNDRGRRLCYQDNVRKITLNKRSNKKHGSGRRVGPLDCFKITSLSRKRSK